MKLKQKKSNKKIPFILAIVVIFIVAISVYVFAFNGSIFGWQFRKDDPTVNLDPPTNEQKETGNQTKRDAIEKNQEKPDNEDTPGADNSSDSLSVSFSTINQNENGLQIRVMIQEVFTDGTCVVTLTHEDQVVTKTASIYPMASVSTCKGFEIPIAELSAGTWNIEATVTNHDRSGQAITTTEIK